MTLPTLHHGLGRLGQRTSRLGLLLLIWSATAALAWAHGDVHPRILELTQQIARHPTDPKLYFKRGELYRVHGDWDAAFADYDRARQLDPTIETLDLACGRLFLEADWPHSAAQMLSRFLLVHPDHVQAWTLRARAYEKLGRPLDAARDYAAAISRARPPTPDLYIARARVLTAAGQEHYEEALRGLNAGIKQLGPLVTLELYAIDLEVKMKRFDAALARLDALAKRLPRMETWLARRGEILEQAGRPAQARQAYAQALEALRKLPPARRNVPAMRELEKRLQQALAKLTGDSPSTKAP